jgi:hypothetical protein
VSRRAERSLRGRKHPACVESLRFLAPHALPVLAVRDPSATARPRLPHQPPLPATPVDRSPPTAFEMSLECPGRPIVSGTDACFVMYCHVH